nr:immunoglobulin heavy chain junction region [Mus musculus]
CARRSSDYAMDYW